MADLSLKYLLFGEDKTASSSIKGVGTQAHSTASLVAGGMSKIGNAVGGEVGEMINRVSEGFEKLGERGKGMGAKLKAGGAGIMGLGIAFSAMASSDVEAQNQLKVAIDNTGGSFSDYKEEIEKAIKKQENFGNSAVQTQDAMRVLTQATNDPKKAIEMMSVVSDLAAAKHISLSDAALKVAKVYGGAGRVLKEFGITMVSTKTATHDLQSATKKHETAVTTLASAQKKLSDLEAIDGPKKKLSVSQQIQLRNAHDAVTKALTGVKETTTDLTIAQDKANKSTHAADDAVTQLADKVKGQASASVDTFTGRLTVMRTKATDAAAQFGQKFGPAITMTGVGVTALGTFMQILASRQAAAALTTDVATGATVRQTFAAKIAAAGQWLWNAAMSANPIGLVIAGIALLIGAIYLIATKTTWFQTIWEYTTGAIGKAWQWMWNTILAPIFRFVLDGIGSMIGGISNMLLALGHVPGFGWATTAGENMKSAAAQAHALASNIKDIPDKKVTVTVGWNVGDVPFLPGKGPVKGNPLFNVGVHARGTSSFEGGLTWINEEGPELVQLPRGTAIHSAGNTASMRAGNGRANGAGPQPQQVPQRATLHIEHYEEAHRPPNLLAADLAFLLRTAP